MLDFSFPFEVSWADVSNCLPLCQVAFISKLLKFISPNLIHPSFQPNSIILSLILPNSSEQVLLSQKATEEFDIFSQKNAPG